MIYAWRGWQKTPNTEDVLKGMAAGMIGGLIGSWLMNQVHTVSRALQRAGGYSGNGTPRQRTGDPPSATGRRAPANGQRKRSSRQSENTGEAEEAASDESATVRTAQMVSRRIARRELGFQQERLGGQIAHYGFGTVMGAIYGGLIEVMPKASTGWGLPFGLAVWLFGDELMLPLLGLGRKPTKVSLGLHAESFAAHLAYGLTSDTVRRLLRPRLE